MMSQILADFSLLLVTLVWGTTFVTVKNAIRDIGPLTFVGVRFLIGGVVLLLWYALVGRRRRGNETSPTGGSDIPAIARNAAAAVVTGVALMFSYITQTFGLLYVPAGKAAFITGLSVVLVPLFSSLMLKERPGINGVIGVAMAALGLGFMSLKLPFGLALGDFLVFLCALGFAAHIILVGRFSARMNPILFTAIQLLTVALGSLIFALIFETPFTVPRGSISAILFTALLATAGAFLVQSAVQRYTSSTHTALIFSAEPVFGAVFAWLWAKEVLAAREIIGGALVLIGMLVAEMESLQPTRTTDQAATEKAK